MKLLVPVIDDRIELIKDTLLELKNAGQNEVFLEKCDATINNTKQSNNEFCYIKMPKGTILIVDRIYIRKGEGKEEFNSITFKIKNQKGLPNGRFYLSINRINELDVNFLGQESEIKTESLNKKIMDIMYDDKNNLNSYEDIFKTFKHKINKEYEVKVDFQKAIDVAIDYSNSYLEKNYNFNINDIEKFTNDFQVNPDLYLTAEDIDRIKSEAISPFRYRRNHNFSVEEWMEKEVANAKKEMKEKIQTCLNNIKSFNLEQRKSLFTEKEYKILNLNYKILSDKTIKNPEIIDVEYYEYIKESDFLIGFKKYYESIIELLSLKTTIVIDDRWSNDYRYGMILRFLSSVFNDSKIEYNNSSYYYSRESSVTSKLMYESYNSHKTYDFKGKKGVLEAPMMKETLILNPKKLEEFNLESIISYYDNGKKIKLKEIRSHLTKLKKEYLK